MAEKKQEEQKPSTRLAKNAGDYGYKYTDLAEINKYIESIGETYYQYPDTAENGYDYIYTVRVKDGKQIMPPIRGAKIVETKLANKSNPVQEYGASLTYARRYSLLMTYGLATDDSDAEELTGKQEEPPAKQRKNACLVKKIGAAISKYAEEHNMTIAEIKKTYEIGDKATSDQMKEVYKELTGEEYAE